MSSGADGIVPSRAFRSKEVTIDSLFDIYNGGLGLLMGRISVLVPPIEASLITRVVQLTVMDRANLLLGFQVVLLRQGTRVQD